MKKTSITILLLALVFTTIAQTNCTVKKAYAFYTVSVPGMQMTDDNGNPIPPKVDIARFIYFECKGKQKPGIISVTYNSIPLSATITAVEGKTVIPGDYAGNNLEHKITAKRNNSLWRINLVPLINTQIPETECKDIIIKISINGKTAIIKPDKETQLMTMPRY